MEIKEFIFKIKEDFFLYIFNNLNFNLGDMKLLNILFDIIIKNFENKQISFGGQN